MMSDRRYQPSAWRAKATRQGMPTRFLGLEAGNGHPVRLGSGVVLRVCLLAAVVDWRYVGAGVPVAACAGRIRIPEHEPARPIPTQHAPDLAEPGHQPLDVLLRGPLQAELAVHAVVPKSPIRRRGHDAVHGLRGQRPKHVHPIALMDGQPRILEEWRAHSHPSLSEADAVSSSAGVGGVMRRTRP